MLARCFGAIVDFCIRHAPVIIAITVILGLGSAVYVERHFGVNSNFDKLLSPNLPWVKRDAAYKAAFPQQATSILAVVTAPTPEFAGVAAAALRALYYARADCNLTGEQVAWCTDRLSQTIFELK